MNDHLDRDGHVKYRAEVGDSNTRTRSQAWRSMASASSYSPWLTRALTRHGHTTQWLGAQLAAYICDIDSLLTLGEAFAGGQPFVYHRFGR